MARVLKIQCHVFRLYIRFVLLGMTSVNFSLAFVSLFGVGFLILVIIDVLGWTVLYCGVVLCIIGCSAASLTSTQ